MWRERTHRERRESPQMPRSSGVRRRLVVGDLGIRDYLVALVLPGAVGWCLLGVVTAFWDMAMHWAALRGNTRIVNVLLSRKASAKALGKESSTPLHRAAREGHTEIIRLLLDAGAYVNAQDAYGNTPLYWAAGGGSAELVMLLLDAGANVNLPNSERCTPLHVAAMRKCIWTAELLLDRGANVNAPNKDGETPLHVAASEGLTGTVKVLVDHGADVNARARCLHLPLRVHPSGEESAVESLIVEIWTANDSGGFTPLHFAAAAGRTETAKLLLARGADPNAPAGDGSTPLHFAAFCGHTLTASVLLAGGANVNACVFGCISPLRLALWGEQVETTGLLRRRGEEQEPTPRFLLLRPQANPNWQPHEAVASSTNRPAVSRQTIRSGHNMDEMRRRTLRYSHSSGHSEARGSWGLGSMSHPLPKLADPSLRGVARSVGRTPRIPWATI